jgi:hypothetical protein
VPFKTDGRRTYAEMEEQRLADLAANLAPYDPAAYVNIQEFCRIARISRSTLDRLRRKRPTGFPVEFQPVGRPLFRRRDVHLWIEAQPLW